jgi:hypothetical protein
MMVSDQPPELQDSSRMRGAGDHSVGGVEEDVESIFRRTSAASMSFKVFL